MAWDKDKPAATTSLANSNPEMLENNASLETALNREHEFSTGGTLVDQIHHKKGSARAYFNDTEPATRRDGSAFNSEDLGSLWFDSNSSPDNQFNVLTATTPTWTPVSNEIIATLLASSRTFGVNLTVDGILSVGGVVNITGTTNAARINLTGKLNPTDYSASNGGFLTDITMAANASDKVASQRSIKAYVDNNIGSANYSPTSYSGQESVLEPNGRIIKQGQQSSVIVGSDTTESFAVAFPTAITRVTFNWKGASNIPNSNTNVVLRSQSASQIKFRAINETCTVEWIAIGY